MPQEPERQHPIWNPRLRQKLAQVFKEIIDDDPMAPSAEPGRITLPTIPMLIALALEDANYWDTRDPNLSAFGLEERPDGIKPPEGLRGPLRSRLHTGDGRELFPEKHKQDIVHRRQVAAEQRRLRERRERWRNGRPADAKPLNVRMKRPDGTVATFEVYEDQEIRRHGDDYILVAKDPGWLDKGINDAPPPGTTPEAPQLPWLGL